MLISDKGHTQIKKHYNKNKKETAGQPLQTSSKLSNTNGTAIKQGKRMHEQKTEKIISGKSSRTWHEKVT
jgi:hypothetical protein